MNNKEIFKIVLTGGPCGGKTSALNYIKKRLETKGYKILILPETPTELFKSGMSIGEFGVKNEEFQDFLIKRQLETEKIYSSYAKKSTDQKVILVCDRGLIDANAYCDHDTFNSLLKDNGTDIVKSRDSYDAVFHLTTAAIGAEEFYTCANNEARSEGLEAAANLDRKITEVWNGHPHYRIIDNSTNFESKLDRLINEIYNYLGIQLSGVEHYLIKMPNIETLSSDNKIKEVSIFQFYTEIIPEELEVKYVRRGNARDYIYLRVQKKKINGQWVKTSKIVSDKDFASEFVNANHEIKPIQKNRYYFILENQYIEIDIFPFWKEQAILTISKNTGTVNSLLKSVGIEIIQDITHDQRYKNKNLAVEVPSPNSSI